MGKAMTDSIKSIRNFISGKPLEKQGYGRPYEETPIRRIQEARTSITRKDKIPAAQEFALIEMAETTVAEAVQMTNVFFNGKWAAYQKQAEATPVKLFKEFKPVE